MLLVVVAAFWRRTAALSAPVAVAPWPVVFGACSGAATRGPAAARWTLAAALLGSADVASGPVVVVPGPGGAVRTTGAGLLGATAGPVETAASLEGAAAVPLGGVAGLLLPRSAVGRAGPGAGLLGPVAAPAESVVVVGAAGMGGLPPEPAVARWTLTAAPLERGAALPGPAAVLPAPAARSLEPVAVPPPDAGPPGPVETVLFVPVGTVLSRPVGAGCSGLVGVRLPEAAGAPTGPPPGARSTSTAAPAEGAPAA